MIRIPGIGPARAKALEKAGLYSLEDLLYRFPISFRDYTRIMSIALLQPGEECAFCGEVLFTRRQFGEGVSRVTARVTDGTGEVECVWFNQPYLSAKLIAGSRWLFYGTAQLTRGYIRVVNPSVEVPGENSGLMPIYPAVAGVPQKTYRAMVRTAIDTYIREQKEALPAAFRARYTLVPLQEAILNAHMPSNHEALKQARYRLSFEELLMVQLALSSERAAHRPGVALSCGWDEIRKLLSQMPFTLTGAQKRVMDEIFADLRTNDAMARLVQGDVGSGKTALAYISLYIAWKNGYQGAMMAPTEILARQHYDGACRLLEPLGIRLSLLTGSLTRVQREKERTRLATGKADIAFGTHALISDGVDYKRLALVITDEQHRFGVRHRTRLSQKGELSGLSPNVLVMSATPIPRTLALILYGDLDISIVDELPPGRTPIRTHIVPEQRRWDMYGFLQKQMAEGGQVYVVCPLVEDSQALEESSAVSKHKELTEVFPDFRIGIVHGRQPPKEKAAQLEAFASGETSLLVSTTVIEVGVNVPNAGVMVIEGADRFGLAQLHQLRGRVGRGTRESYCFLIGQSRKLRVLTSTNDGFIISQKDLETRGPGELLGTRQSGMLEERLAALTSDASMLAITQEAAKNVLSTPDTAESIALIEAAKKRFGKRLEDMARN